jgi:hypothetical protein
VSATDRMTCAEALELAQRHASKGFHVFPIAIAWDNKKQATDKWPLTDHAHLDATTDPAALERMFNAKSPGPGAVWGVGVCPGRSGYLVLDPDIKNGDHGDDELAALEAEHGRLDTARAVTASGGGHVWIKKSAGVHIGNADLAPGVNVRADDGWVVAIGTRTPWGSWDHDDTTPHHAIDCPEWLLDRLASTNGHGGSRGRWSPLDRSKLHPSDLAALEALEALGGHDPYIGGDGAVLITRPDKTAGSSASIGYIGPGIVKVFTSSWPPLVQDRVYDADDLVGPSQKTHKAHKSSTRENGSPPGADNRASESPDGEQKSRSANSEFSEYGDWDVPVALGGADTPAFPVDLLPGWRRGFATETARAQQVPVDLPAVLALAAVATSAGGRVVVEVRSGWREPLNIYTAVVLPPGERKSPVFRVVADPIADVERVLIEKARPKIVEAQALRATAKKAAERAVNEAAKAEPNANGSRSTYWLTCDASTSSSPPPGHASPTRSRTPRRPCSSCTASDRSSPPTSSATSATRPASPHRNGSPPTTAPPPSRRPAGHANDTGSTPEATASSTTPCTSSPSPKSATTPPAASTTNASWPRASPRKKPSAP